ncbi:excalibur calcium-binding domain-containing protein [Streptomyces vilmorinianum]|uniref:excalibur calcium-binding domain-containing protein n=1 Tax=Streptomyces vilmorinianum TaxID=3051092 RepID=UPI0020C78390|nr:excalibur calcium-binding domain-containing protein [Streptomyces vilmorinianum]
MRRILSAGCASLLALALAGASGCGSSGEEQKVETGPTVTRTQTVTAEPTPTPTPPSTPPKPTAAPTADAASTVEAYFAAINARDYRRAWDLGGKNLGGSYESFQAGFADTVQDTVRIVDVQDGAVTVTLDALQADGTVRSFEGTYEVRNGVIVDADVRLVSPTPESAAPTVPEDTIRSYPPGPPAGVPDVDCSDLPGPVWVGPSDPHRLDRDGDGIGCELD